MGNLAALRGFLQGKKTIFGGAFLIAIAVVGSFYGKLSLIDATTVAATGISICGIGAKANRFLGALSQVAQAGVDLRLGNRAALVADLKPVIQEAVQSLAPEDTGSGQPLAAINSIPAAQMPALVPAAAVPLVPSLSGDDAMKPALARMATAEEWRHLQQVAEAAQGAKS